LWKAWAWQRSVANATPLQVPRQRGLTWPGISGRGWAVRYLDSYAVSITANTIRARVATPVASQTIHDVFAQHQFAAPPVAPDASAGPGFSSHLANTDLRLGVRNLFGLKPPFDAGNVQAYYSLYGDPRGRATRCHSNTRSSIRENW